MSDYEFDAYDDEPPRRESPAAASGPELPGGVSLQTAAAVLLVAVLLATLYLFFGPLPGDGEPGADEPVASATPRATSTIASTPDRAAATRGATAGAGASAARTPTRAASGATTAATTAAATAATSAVATLPAAAGLRSGGYARVTGTGTFGLRMRFGPGLDFLTIRFADEGETLELTGGPERGDDLEWWRVRDDLGNVGWVAAEYLVPVAAPGGWSPPVASPTFPAGAASLEESQGNAAAAPVAAVTVEATRAP